MRSRTVAVLCVLVSLVTAASAEETTAAAPLVGELTLDSAMNLAAAASSSVSALRHSLSEKLRDAGIVRFVQGVGMFLGGGAIGDTDDSFSYSANVAVAASVPLLPQLSMDGSFSTAYAEGGAPTFGGSVGLSFSPLADATAHPRDLLDIERTAIHLDSALRAASSVAVSRLLGAVMAERYMELAEEKHAVARLALETTEELYERGQASEASYKAAQATLRARNHELRLSRLSAERTLELLAWALALPVGQIALPTLEDLGLEGLVEEAVALVGSADPAALADAAPGVLLSSIDVQEADLDISSARPFSPSLSITASAALPDLNYTVGAQFGFTVSDFDLTARRVARKAATLARLDHEHVVTMARLDAREALLELEFSLEDLRAALDDLAEAQLDMAETQYYAKRGEATRLDLAQADLALGVAEEDVAEEQVGVVENWFVFQFVQY